MPTLCALAEWDGAFLILPGGTMNLLAKALHASLDPAEIIHAAQDHGALPIPANWSKGNVTRCALSQTLAGVESMPKGQSHLHRLSSSAGRGRHARRLGGAGRAGDGRRACRAEDRRYVHDPFEVEYPTAAGKIRLIGAGTLCPNGSANRNRHSTRFRSRTRASRPSCE